MGKIGDFEAIKKNIAQLLHQPEYDDGNAGPVLVRLAWYISSLDLLLLPLAFTTAPDI